MAEYSGLQTSSDDQVGGRTEKICEPCLKKKIRRSAVVFCADCKQFQCSKCREAHELFDVTSGHAIRPITDITQRPPGRVTERRATKTLDMKGIDKCEEHDKLFEFFCVDHDSLCCSTCVIKEHRKCDEVNTISDHVANPSRTERTNLKDAESTFTKLKSRTTTFLQDSKKRNNAVKQRMEDIPKAIDRMKESVFQYFEDFKRKALSEARSAEHLMLSENNANQSNLNDALKSLKVAITVLKTSDEQGSTHERFIALTVLKSKMKSAQQLFEVCKDEHYTIDFCLKFNQALDLTSAVDKVGILHIDTDYDAVGESTLITPATLKLDISTNIVQAIDENVEPIYAGLAFVPDGRLAIVDGSKNYKFLIVSSGLQRLGTYSFKTFAYDVACISNHEVAVAGGTSTAISILGVSDSRNITLNRTLQTNPRYCSICTIDENTFAVGCCDDKRPARMISTSGTERDFKGLYEKKYTVTDLKVGYIAGKNALVLSDRDANVVYIYSQNEQCATRCEVQNASIKEPRGICSGPNDSVFVCSWGRGTIVQVSSKGKVVNSYPMDMDYPRSICISKDNSKLAVFGGVSGNIKLKTYTID